MLIRLGHDQAQRGIAHARFLGSAQLLGGGSNAQAVILYSSADRNTSPPPSSPVDLGYAAWNLEAQWGPYLATPIDATHFIAAQHIGLASSTITFQGTAYQVNTSSDQTDPNSDLAIWSLQSGSFSTFAPLYNAAVNGSEVGNTLTVIGRGTQRGAAVTVNGNTVGWQWGAQ